ncbi:hypothetical protein OS31_25440 [Dickeya oryzae]
MKSCGRKRRKCAKLAVSYRKKITPEARETVEMLAGMPYESLWGNNNIGYLNRHKAPARSIARGTPHHGVH